MIKQKKDAGICRNKKEKATQEKITVQVKEMNQKVLAKEVRLEISTKGKTIETRQGIPKQRKKIPSSTGRKWHENIPATGCRRNRTILDWNIATKKHNEKTKWIKNMTRELEGLEEGPKAEIHIDLLKTTVKKYLTGKHQATMEYMDSGSRNSPPFTTDLH